MSKEGEALSASRKYLRGIASFPRQELPKVSRDNLADLITAPLQEAVPCSLSGTPLPLNWPASRLVSFDELEEQNPPDYLKFHLIHGKQELWYSGVHHSKVNPPPHIKELLQVWQPDVILLEGDQTAATRTYTSEEEALKRGGEKGYTRFLAQQYSEARKYPLSIASGDMQPRESIDGLRSAGLSDEAIAVYLITRGITSICSLLQEKNTALSVEKVEQEFQPYFEIYQKNDLAFLETDEEGWTMEKIQRGYQKMTGKDFHLLTVNYATDFRDILAIDFQQRNSYQVTKIANSFRYIDNVLVLMGSSHGFASQPALEDFFA